MAIGGVTIPNQGVELAKTLSASFQRDGGSDGLLGLAWPTLNTVTPQQQATPVENMINQNIISSVNSQRQPFITINHTYWHVRLSSQLIWIEETIMVFTHLDLLMLPKRVYQSLSKC